MITIRHSGMCLSRLLMMASIAAQIMSPAIAADATPQQLSVAKPAQSPQQSQGINRSVRLAMNKSLVLRLPGAAKDVLIGNPAIVDAVVKSQSTVYLFSRAVGSTNIFFFDETGRQLLSLDIEVTRDPGELQSVIARTLPGSRIKVDSVGDKLVLSGQAMNPTEASTAVELATKLLGAADGIVNTIEVLGNQQVMLKVRMVEMQRSTAKTLGIDTSGAISTGDLASKFAISNAFNTPPPNSAHLAIGNNDKLDVTLRALEKNGLVRTLAEPTLTAISGQGAKFLAGGEFPVPVASTNDQLSVQFKQFGVGLDFTPIVIDEGRINLKIRSEVSELSTEGAVSIPGTTGSASISIPSVKTRTAETTVELPSGGSMMMAGIIQDKQTQTINGFPALKNLPVLGALFRSRDFQSNQTELVLIVTPIVVGPVAGSQLATPIDQFNQPSDSDTILFGRLNKVYGRPGGPGTADYHGNVGFIVE